MNINKNNYEEFFLCYADGELSAADCLLVEDFVAQNPELEQEFSLTIATVLPVDNILFTDTAFLFRYTAASENMQEDMLMHLDGELNPEKAILIEAAISKETVLEKEWTLLNQTKLKDESIVFEDKESLYRHEKVRVIPPYFWRIAAAAVFVGICTLGGYKILHQPDAEVENNLAVVSQKQGNDVPANSKAGVEKNKIAPASNELIASNSVATTLDKTEKETTSSGGPLQQNNSATGDIDKNALAQTKNDAVNKTMTASDKNFASNETPLNSNTPTVQELNNKIPQINISVPTQAMAVVNTDLSLRKEIIDIDLSPRRATPKVIAAALKEEDNSNTTRIFYFDTKDLKNTKAGEIFKKVGGILSRKNKIINKKSIKIANLEISL